MPDIVNGTNAIMTGRSYRAPVTDIHRVLVKLTGRAIEVSDAEPQTILELADMLEYDRDLHAAVKTAQALNADHPASAHLG